jgi:organic radical activating enzyme
MTWHCSAFDHGVTVFPNGKIGPCCKVPSSYLKPISELHNSDRFSDLKTWEMDSSHPCDTCIKEEAVGINSYKNFFNGHVTSAPGLQFVDIRNTNLCNLKCRYCGTYASSQWAEELGHLPVIKYQPLTEYKDLLITDSLHWMYFTGGEPLIISDHWALLEELIDNNRAANISLMYNTNLTTIKYKDKNIIDIWKKFKKVFIQCSIDTVGEPLEYIRSGASWDKITSNLAELLAASQNSNITIALAPVLSILNIWTIDKLYEYASLNNISVELVILTHPDYLSISAIPDELKSLAMNIVNILEAKYNVNDGKIINIKSLIEKNTKQHLFRETILHVLLLDNLRNEKLFDLLPFKSLAIDKILTKHKYDE